MQSEAVSFLRDLWYCAGPAVDFKPGTVRHKTLLGEPLVFGRGRDGAVFALRDLCPHRGVPLSKGRLVAGASGGPELECPYHGWRFAPSGACVAIPSLVPDQDMEVGRVRVRRYPTRERQGLVWVFMSEEARQREEPDTEPPEIPVAAGTLPRLTEAMTFHCDVDHAVIGLMDPAHGPFVHRSWWWRSAKSIHEKAKRFHPSPLGFTMTSHAPSKNSAVYRLLGGDVNTEISFRLPGIRIESIRAGRHRVVGLTTVTPVSSTETEVRQMFYWNVPWLTLLRPALRPFARAFLDQDRSMVDLQAEGLKFNPRLMLIDDADMQAKWYFRLRKEWEASRAETRPFEHPIREPAVLRWRS